MSNAVGITAEYNPFHTGHMYQIDKLRDMGFDTVVCALGGSISQRGIPYMFSKWDRTKAALCCGANFVAEIPCPYSSLSAEGFAWAGIAILKSTGVNAISFGSESGDTKVLKNAARYLLSDEFDGKIKKALADGELYPAARFRILNDKFGNSVDFTAPNDILAVEYIKACQKMDWDPEIIVIRRDRGSLQTGSPGNFVSSGYIRDKISAGETSEAFEYIPRGAKEIFSQSIANGKYFYPDDPFYRAVMLNLRRKTARDFSNVPDSNPELAGAFVNSLKKRKDIRELFEFLPTKRYTRARMWRIMMSALLGVPRDLPKTPPYIRILGFSGKGEEILKSFSKDLKIPVSHSPKILSRASDECKKVAELETKATDLLSLFMKNPSPPGEDLRGKIIKT